MKILLVDDHVLVRAGIRLLLSQLLPTATVFEVGDGRAAVVAARREQPDICLLDLSMPGLNGIDALPLLYEAAAATRVLVVSMHVDRQHVTEALRAGAKAYLVKEAAVEELADALRCVMHDRPFLSRRVADELVRDYAQEASLRPAEPRTPTAPALLSPRQREVLQLIAEGQATREIAARLNLSIKTVETHRSEVMRRLDIRDVAGLTRFAVRHGLVSADR